MIKLDFQQIKTGKNNYTPIDDDVINSIACIKAFESDKANKMLHEHHKNLLRYSKNKNNNKEVGLFWDLDNVERKPLRIEGELEGFNISQNPKVSALVKNPRSIMTVVVMHNHPRNGLFSTSDIRSFIDFNSIVLMTAVCNDGTIYMLRKEDGFNPLLMERYYNEGVQLSNKAAREERIRKAQKLNLDIRNPANKEKIGNLPTKPYYYGIKNVAKHAREIGITYRCSVRRK